MKKTFTEAKPRSATDAAPAGTPPLGQPGATMTLDELPDDLRTQNIENSLERIDQGNPVVAAAAPGATATTGAQTQPASIAPPKPVVRAEPASSVIATPAAQAKPALKMISTPIDAEVRRRVRELRLSHDISEAFVLETALRDFFGDRENEDIAMDLRARGGRLRRNR